MAHKMGAGSTKNTRDSQAKRLGVKCIGSQKVKSGFIIVRKREKSLEKIAEHDPERARKLSALRNLLPPRPSGAAAMMRGAPDVDVILAWHVGFEGLDTFGGILAALNRRPAPILFSARRVANSDVPRGRAFNEWLDRQWVRMDAEVGAAFASRHDNET